MRDGNLPFDMGVTAYAQILTELHNLHKKKAEDYAALSNPYSNFEASARYANISVDQAFDTLIGTKIARLLNLKESCNEPNNESVEDTEIDLANYILLKKAYRRHRELISAAAYPIAEVI